MGGEFLNGIIVNAVFLIGLAVAYNFLPKTKVRYKYIYQAVIGIILGYLVINIMRYPIVIEEGVIIDTRSILVSITALFFGAIPALVVMVFGILYRVLVIGDVGALPGALLFVTAGTTGLLWRKYRFHHLSKGFLRRSVEIIIFTYIVHIAMPLLFLLLPIENNIELMISFLPFTLGLLPLISITIASLIYISYDNHISNQKIIETQAQFVKAVQDAPVPIAIHNKDGKVITFNKAWTKATGYNVKNAANIQIWVEKAFKENAIKALSKINDFMNLEDKVFNSEFEFYTSKNRKVTWDFHASVIAIQKNDEKLVMTIAKDVTEKKKLEAQLINLSFKDGLTNLYNRRFFEEELDRLNVKRNYPLSLIFVDVNALKLTNDAFGHNAGDKLLKMSSEAFKDSFRQDDIIARVGGDEFVVILPATDAETTKVLINRVNANLKGKKVKNIQISLAIGSYTSTSIKLSVGRVYKLAEEDMYTNKLRMSKEVKEKAISVIVNTLFRRDHKTKIHAIEVSELCELMGRAVGMDESAIEILKKAGYLHDIGKITMPKELLKKKTEYDKVDLIDVRKHPEVGYRILNNGYNLTTYASIILDHHERWDGAGYPQKKHGREVLLESRIIAICDAFASMTSLETYKTKRYSFTEATDELMREKGMQFDPELVDIFVKKVIPQL